MFSVPIYRVKNNNKCLTNVFPQMFLRRLKLFTYVQSLFSRLVRAGAESLSKVALFRTEAENLAATTMSTEKHYPLIMRVD